LCAVVHFPFFKKEVEGIEGIEGIGMIDEFQSFKVSL
jgi:hypothetical protein